jgi:hypothetical protein
MTAKGTFLRDNKHKHVIAFELGMQSQQFLEKIEKYKPR